MSNASNLIYEPNTTQIPNVIIDYWMYHLSDTQFKILLVIARKTLGWHKRRDKISKGQISEYTGFKRNSIRLAIKHLEELKLIKCNRGLTKLGDSDSNTYEVNILELNRAAGGLSKNITRDIPEEPRVGFQKSPTKPKTKPNTTKGNDLVDAKSLPFSSNEENSFEMEESEEELVYDEDECETIVECEKNMPEEEFLERAKTKFPLKLEQQPIFDEMKQLDLDCKDETLMIIIRQAAKNNKLHKLKDAIFHLKTEIIKGTQFKKPKIAFLRAVLDDKISPVTQNAIENKKWAERAAKHFNWKNLIISDKYVLCEKTQKEIPTNKPPDEFKEMLGNLYRISQNY